MKRVIFILKPLDCQMNKKNKNCCVARNVMSSTTRYALVLKVDVVDVTDQSCSAQMIGKCTGRCTLSINCKYFNVLLTVHLSITLVINQINVQNLVL